MAAAASDGLSPGALWAKLREDWWVALGEGEQNRIRRAGWREQVETRSQQLKTVGTQSKTSSPLVLIAESDPADFLAGFLAALIEGWSVALGNPMWGTQEWESVGRLISPDLTWGEKIPRSLAVGHRTTPAASPKLGLCQSAILIPTGGSSGQVKFACHSWRSLMASVEGFLGRFSPNGEAISTCCVLPVYHVSGLMQILRAWVSGGQAAVMPFKRLIYDLCESSWDGGRGGGQQLGLAGFGGSVGAHPMDFLTGSNWFISLVPTQLERLLQSNQAAWLRQFQAVFLGGAPAWPTLMARAASQQIPLCLSYGMTETAAMVTALMPAVFLQGKRSSGQALPHVRVQILNNGQPVGAEEIGQVVVCSRAIAQTYYSSSSPSLPCAFSQNTFYTDDLGYISADGHLHISGRASNKIISGGENIFPAEVEAALRSTGQVKDVCVVGLPHPQWGEAVTAAYVPASSEVSAESLKQALAEPIPEESAPALSRYKHPKYWVPLQKLPRNAQGKLNRQQLLQQLLRQIPS